MGPLKQSLVETISLKRCNCSIFGLTETVAFFAKEAFYLFIYFYFFYFLFFYYFFAKEAGFFQI